MARKIESLFLAGPAGRLEALIEEPETGDAAGAALVCHPHPQHGGTMHNKVVYRIARGLRHSGYVVLRFNYRGVNLSEGEYADGEGEIGDAQTALSYLRGRYPRLPYLLAGFSFGSRIVCRLGCMDRGAMGLIAVGFPTMYRDRSDLSACPMPRCFIQSTNDQFGSVGQTEETVDAVPDPKRLTLVEARDHFFDGGLEKLEEAVIDSVSWLLSGVPAAGGGSLAN